MIELEKKEIKKETETELTDRLIARESLVLNREIATSEKAKEERRLNFIKNNPRHPFSKQFTVSREQEPKDKEPQNEFDLTTKLIARNKFVLKRDIIEKRSENKQIKRERATLKIRKMKSSREERRTRKRLRRMAEIVDWYLQGLTYEQVGRKFKVSRERIRQILNTAKREGLDFEIRGMKRREGAYETRTCLCGNSFEVYIPKGGANKRETCSSECKKKYRVGYKYKSPEEARVIRRALSRERYHNDPEYRKRGEMARKNYYLKIRHTPKYIKRQKIHSERWRERIMRDPVKKAKFLEKARFRFQKQKERLHKLKRENLPKYIKLREAENIRHQRYFERMRRDPVRYKAYRDRTKLKSRQYYDRLKSDPKRYKEHIKQIRFRYQKRKLLLDKLGQKNTIEGSVIKNKNGKRKAYKTK